MKLADLKNLYLKTLVMLRRVLYWIDILRCHTIFLTNLKMRYVVCFVCAARGENFLTSSRLYFYWWGVFILRFLWNGWQIDFLHFYIILLTAVILFTFLFMFYISQSPYEHWFHMNYLLYIIFIWHSLWCLNPHINIIEERGYWNSSSIV